MTDISWRLRARHLWNWIMGKRIVHTCGRRGRVLVRTGRNSADRDTGGQWYLQSYDTSLGTPPLPRCSRGRLDAPQVELTVATFDGDELNAARDWYETRHGPLPGGHRLALVCVYDPGLPFAPGPRMGYRPDEIFEVEFPWLGTDYDGPSFTSYFGTWYGAGTLTPDDAMDFEIFWKVETRARPLPSYGATW